MAAAAAFGLAIGLALGALGGGGSVLAVPVLVYVLGQSASEATTISLLVVSVAAVTAGLRHARAGRLCWGHGRWLTLAAVPGLALGTLAGGEVSGDLLLVAFAILMLVAAAVTWRAAGDATSDEPPGRDACPPVPRVEAVVAGVAIGFLTSFFGVGGGFLIVPALVALFALTVREAIGTSLAIIAAISLLGFALHLLAGRSVDLELGASMTIAAAVGAVTGAAVAARLPQRRLGHAFAVLVFALAVYVLAATALLGGPPGG